jgi:uncharacterized phage infection (PIP) family protein YhgE
VEKVGNGSKLVDQAGATMQEIVDSVRRVTAIMGEISNASREQTAGIEQINEAITQMDQTTQQNAALVEEAAAAADTLQKQASGLTEVVSVFRLDNAGARAVGAANVARLPASRKETVAVAPRRPKLAVAARTRSAQEWEEF